LRNTTGTVRFDLSEGGTIENWYLKITAGDIQVARKKGNADAVVSCDKTLFSEMVRGEVNAMAAVLRGVLIAHGDLGLALSVARVFRGAHDARPAAPAAGYAQRLK
jgi:putative sterol carrier protein